MGVNQSKFSEPQTEVLTTSADGRVGIQFDDLGPDERKQFRKFADKIKSVKDQTASEMLQALWEEVGQYIDQEAWMGQAYVRIGLVGLSGAGKSTFINSLRGLRPTDPGAADVGVKETTTIPTEYPHPEHKHVILVDFPGNVFKLKEGLMTPVGFDTNEYIKKNGYQARKKMEECNVFLVFTSGRAHDNAVWIAKKCKDMGKKLLFVRSKFDSDVTNTQEDKPTYFKNGQDEGESHLLNEVKADFVSKLNEQGFGQVDEKDVFIIGGKYDKVQMGEWDTPLLKQAILKQLDIQQQMLFITTCQDFSPTMARAKAQVYRSRAWKVALGTAPAGAIPFAGAGVTIVTIATTVALFKKGFGLNEDSVRKLATLTGKDAAELQHFVDERLSIVHKITQFLQGEIDRQSLEEALVAAGAGGVLGAAIAVDVTIDLTIPFVGGLVTAPASFVIAWKALNLVVERLEKCALDLYEFAFR